MAARPMRAAPTAPIPCARYFSPTAAFVVAAEAEALLAFDAAEEVADAAEPPVVPEVAEVAAVDPEPLVMVEEADPEVLDAPEVVAAVPLVAALHPAAVG